MTGPRRTEHVPVAGGTLTVHRLGPAGDGRPVVIAVHGITANGLAWGPVAARLADRAVLYAPDLRGRAGSRDVGEPRGLSAHAEDVLAVMDAVGVDQVVLAGHSMGAFVAALATARAPERVTRLVLVDGGFTLPLPPQAAHLSADQLIQAVIGLAMTRLSMTFDSPRHYEDFWSRHPALGPALQGPDRDLILAYLHHDLVAAVDGPGLVSSCRTDHVRVDGTQVLLDEEAATAPLAACRAGVPTGLLWSERGLMNEPVGLYTRERLAALGLPATLTTEVIAGTNHYSIIFDPAAGTVADRILGT